MQSKLSLHSHFDECESEELRRVSSLQDGVGCLLLDSKNQCIGQSSELFGKTVEELVEALSHLTSKSAPTPTFFELTNWVGFHHRTGEHTLIEFRPLENEKSIPEFDLPVIINNHMHYCQNLCDRLRSALPFSRVMVYQLHNDGSGEVIAESIDTGVDPFIGLHYPATDIPQQARALYSEIFARSIFSADPPSNELHAEGDHDLTQLISRGVSPYHLSYLRNMGSVATASIAIQKDGKLWGLVSLHSDQSKAPSLYGHSCIRNLYHSINAAMGDVFMLSEHAQVKRQSNLLSRFEQELTREFDLAYSLLLSNFSLHRMLGGVGVALQVSDGLSQIGVTPSRHLTQQLLDDLAVSDNKMIFCDSISGSCLAKQNSSIGGYAYYRLSDTPHCAIIVFRRQVSQTVAWGGDPRQHHQNDSSVRYTPRASFERWVETVEGSCLPWEASTRTNLVKIIETTMQRFGCNSKAGFSVLLGYSIRQIAFSRGKLMQKLNEQFDQLRQGIAIAIQTESEGPQIVLGINEAASDAFNIPIQEAENMELDTFASATNVPFQKMEIGKTQQASVWTHDQGHKDLEVEVYQQLDFKNEATGESLRVLIYFMTDITQAKRVELALGAAYQRSQKMAQIQTELFSKLMHELKTPLNSIIGFASFLNDQTLSDAERQDFINRVVRNAHALKHVLDNTGLENARLRAEVAKDTETSDLVALIENVIADLTLMSAERSISVEFSCNDLRPRVRLSPMAMGQVITNLVHNSIKYSEPGQNIVVQLEPGTSGIQIVIKDQGMGMSKEQIQSATEPFTRFTERPGSGLGLSIVKQLLEANDCELELHSALGHGTQAIIAVPGIRITNLRSATDEQAKEKLEG